MQHSIAVSTGSLFSKDRVAFWGKRPFRGQCMITIMRAILEQSFTLHTETYLSKALLCTLVCYRVILFFERCYSPGGRGHSWRYCDTRATRGVGEASFIPHPRLQKNQLIAWGSVTLIRAIKLERTIIFDLILANRPRSDKAPFPGSVFIAG